MLLADALEHAGSADKEKLIAALAASTFKAECFDALWADQVRQRPEPGACPATMQSLKGEIEVIAPEEPGPGQAGALPKL